MSNTRLRDVLERVRDWERQYTPTTSRPHRPTIQRWEERAADRITGFAGSMPFVYLHGLWFGAWIVLNIGLVGAAVGGWLVNFDPYPFGLLTMVVSLEAIFLSTFVLISQNRQAAIADRRAELDYQINVKAEAEVAKLIALMEALVAHHALEDDHSAPATPDSAP